MLREGKTVVINRMRKDLETKFVFGISQEKTWDNFGGGKYV
jgi:hypothetical protein